MQAEQVIQKIAADAQAQADKIVEQAKDKEDAEQDRLDTELSQYNSQTAEIARKAAEDEKAHILAAARMKIAKQYLAEKRSILNEVFDQALQRMRSLDDEQYRSLTIKRLLEAIETGDEEVVVDLADSRIDMDLVKEVNRQLGPGYKGNLRLASAKEDLGGAGFVLRRGKIKTNVSVAVLLDQARKELEIELARDLFGD
ncbi:MAG: V-type ATP synthase subunit E [Phycisphaerae bacterium]|nr:V-type ATP synthase subunit E [Phycisphaerae bacterium]